MITFNGIPPLRVASTEKKANPPAQSQSYSPEPIPQPLANPASYFNSANLLAQSESLSPEPFPQPRTNPPVLSQPIQHPNANPPAKTQPFSPEPNSITIV